MNYIELNKYSGSSTKINKKNDIPYISFNSLDKISWIKNGFSTRLGGVSKNHLYSMNLGLTRGDLEQNVLDNHRIIASAMGVEPENMISGHQTHTTNVMKVGKSDCGKGIFLPRDYNDIDGLITDEKDVVLTTYYADCVPLYLVDIKNKAIGLSHSGWRGTVNRIGKVTLEAMTREYGTNPKDVIVCIGPSICKACYEVGEDVAKEFMIGFPKNYSLLLEPKDNNKFQLDLWNANKLVFLESGVPAENISVTDICTCCNKNVMFSHRGHNGMRGNLAAFLAIK